MTVYRAALFAASVLVLLPSIAWSDEVGLLIPFNPGETARASEVNDNFEAVKTAVDDNADSIAAETLRAGNAETVNADSIAAETERAGNAETVNADAIAAETLRAGNAETVNADAIAAETLRAGNAETVNADSIAAETERAGNAETVNADAIAAETLRAGNAETVNADAIAAETLRAGNAETVNADSIAAEVAALEMQLADLQAQITVFQTYLDSFCGDGVIEPGIETCDDGNTTDDGNGCSASCEANNVCGNGIIESYFETCDDGGVTGGDGCSALCESEPGWVCTDEPSTCAFRFEACGNGECKLTASDAVFGDIFGFASAIDGDELLIGAENHDAVGVGSGAVYAYRRVGSEYEEVQKKIVPAGLAAGDAFGSAIAIDGDVAVIGARLAKGGNGSAYVFRLVDGQWVEEQELVGIFGEVGPVDGQFGRAVAISGPWIAVGAPRDNFFDFALRPEMGSVTMFEYTNQPGEDPWSSGGGAFGYLFPLGTPAGELFGTSVALDGPVLAVGAVGDDDDADNSGAAFVYSLDAVSGTWTLDRKLKALRESLDCAIDQSLQPDAFSGDNFGISVAVLGDRVVVGADGRKRFRQNFACGFITTANESANGGAYVYKETPLGSGNWDFEVRLEPADANNKKAFGRSLAVDTNVIAVGAFGDDGSGLFSGAAYIYRLSLDSVWALDTKLRASDAQRDDNFGVSVGIDGERVVIGAWKADGSGPQSGAAYGFDL